METFPKRIQMTKDKKAFDELAEHFGNQKWPSVPELAKYFRIKNADMNRQLRRFVEAGWVKVGESDQGPWVEELPPAVGRSCQKEGSGLPLAELEARLQGLRQEREQAEKDGRLFNQSEAIDKVLGKRSEKHS